jgi:hypothetical protein
MPQNTFPVNSGAMPKFDRAAVMRRAWEIFRETYKHPAIKFADIGRKCFAWALRKAWAEARDAARLVAISPEARAARIAVLETSIQHAGFIDSGPAWRRTVTACRDEIRQLQSA